MCNIAGYVGERDAAPVLIDMIRREEGFAGGYYTGIATLSDGKIYYEKLTGTTDRLLALTKAAALPGKIGIIHSRSKAGGGDEWAHPFVGIDRESGKPRIAYIANGSKGVFFDRASEAVGIAERLLRDGYTMSSRVFTESDRYSQLSDGSIVHMSDVMCQLILSYIDAGVTPPDAMESAFCEMPSEIVGLLLSADEPDSVCWSRINMPVSVGFAPDGAYIASTPLAFPDDAGIGEPVLLPALARGRIYKSGFESEHFPAPPTDVARADATVVSAAYGNLIAALDEEGKSFSELAKKAVRPAFGDVGCAETAALTYGILRALGQRGFIEQEKRVVPGVSPDIPAVKYYIKRRKKA